MIRVFCNQNETKTKKKKTAARNVLHSFRKPIIINVQIVHWSSQRWNDWHLCFSIASTNIPTNAVKLSFLHRNYCVVMAVKQNVKNVARTRQKNGFTDRSNLGLQLLRGSTDKRINYRRISFNQIFWISFKNDLQKFTKKKSSVFFFSLFRMQITKLLPIHSQKKNNNNNELP